MYARINVIVEVESRAQLDDVEQRIKEEIGDPIRKMWSRVYVSKKYVEERYRLKYELPGWSKHWRPFLG